MSGLEICQDWRFVRNEDLSGTEIFQARRVTILVYIIKEFAFSSIDLCPHLFGVRGRSCYGNEFARAGQIFFVVFALFRYL